MTGMCTWGPLRMRITPTYTAPPARRSLSSCSAGHHRSSRFEEPTVTRPLPTGEPTCRVPQDLAFDNPEGLREHRDAPDRARTKLTASKKRYKDDFDKKVRFRPVFGAGDFV